MEKKIDELISIIVPVYNVEKYLQKCVGSIINQTYQNIEIILIDDGSTDNSGKVCEELKDRDSRIRVIHKENGGLSSARNKGISVAKGRYLGFIDSDDYIEKEMFGSLYEAIKRTGKDVACCGRIVDIFGEYSNTEFSLAQEQVFTKTEAIKEVLYLETIDVSACDKLYKRELFKEIRYPEGKISEDAAVIFEILEASNGVVHVGKPFYHYVFRNNSITKSKYSEKKYDVINNLKKTQIFIENNHPELVKCFNAYCAISTSALIIDMAQDKEAKRKYKDHYKEYRKVFNSGVWDAVTSRQINTKMRIRLLAIKTHTIALFFRGRRVYALFRRLREKK